MRNNVLSRLAALVLCIVWLAPAAAAEMSVSLSFTCSADVPCVGSTVDFTLTGEGVVDYCVMIVEPDSQQTFLYGASSSYLITKPGLHIIIGYGANGTDSSAPGFARCMTQQTWFMAEDGELPPPEPEIHQVWFFEPLTNSLHICSEKGYMTNIFDVRLMIAEGDEEPDLSTLRIIDDPGFTEMPWTTGVWYYEAVLGYMEPLGLEAGKTYHVAVLEEGVDPASITDFYRFTYTPGYIILTPTDRGTVDIWNQDELEITWYPMPDAIRYEISLTFSAVMPDGSTRTCSIPVEPLSGTAIWPDGLARLRIKQQVFTTYIPEEMQLLPMTLTVQIDAITPD